MRSSQDLAHNRFSVIIPLKPPSKSSDFEPSDRLKQCLKSRVAAAQPGRYRVGGSGRVSEMGEEEGLNRVVLAINET